MKDVMECMLFSVYLIWDYKGSSCPFFYSYVIMGSPFVIVKEKIEFFGQKKKKKSSLENSTTIPEYQIRTLSVP